MYTNPELSIKQTCVLLARVGEEKLPRSAYRRYLADGYLDQPIKRAGRRPVHTLSQVEVCRRRWEAEAARIAAAARSSSSRSSSRSNGKGAKQTTRERIFARFFNL
jgi:hypothetical protein